MAKETGVELSPDRVTALLRKYDVVWRRTKRTIRNLQDPEEVRAAKKRLAWLKKRPARRTPASSYGLQMGQGSTYCPW
jgi:hypothetical protein